MHIIVGSYRFTMTIIAYSWRRCFSKIARYCSIKSWSYHRRHCIYWLLVAEGTSPRSDPCRIQSCELCSIVHNQLSRASFSHPVLCTMKCWMSASIFILILIWVHHATKGTRTPYGPMQHCIHTHYKTKDYITKMEVVRVMFATVEPLLKDSLNKGHHINYLPTKDTFWGTKSRLS